MFILGLLLASVLDGNWPFVALGVFGFAASFFRSQLPNEGKIGLGVYLNHHPGLKWFTAIYLLIMAGLSLKFMGELSEIVMSTNPAVLTLVLFFPFFVLWLKRDYSLYVNSE